MHNRHGAVPILFMILVVVVVGGLGYLALLNKDAGPTPDQQLLGGDRDAHGCIGSAGYSWCEGDQKCLRVWEETCKVATSSAIEEAALPSNLVVSSGKLPIREYIVKPAILDRPAEIEYWTIVTPGTEIVFTKDGKVVLRDGGGLPDVFVSDASFVTQPNDGGFEVYTTSLPNIFVVRLRVGDMGWWRVEDRYFDVPKRSVVFSTKYTNGNDIYLENDFSGHLNLMFAPDCHYDNQGKLISAGEGSISGFELNGKPAYRFSSSSMFIFTCEPTADLSVRTPEPEFLPVGVSSDLSEFYFSLNVGEPKKYFTLNRNALPH